MQRDHDAAQGEDVSSIREVQQSSNGAAHASTKAQPDDPKDTVADVARKIIKPLKEHDDVP